MTQQQEKLSAFMDGESESSDILDVLKQDPELQRQWRRYHVIRSGLRQEASVAPELDITAQVAAALDNEPTIMAPQQRTWRQRLAKAAVVPFARHTGQLAVAASVAVAVILGVQQFNQPATSTAPGGAATPLIGTPGGLAPVSLEQSRPVTRNDRTVLMEKKRKINALITDHEQQLKLKHVKQESAQTQSEQ